MRALLPVLAIGTLSGASVPVQAANTLQLNSDIFVEREKTNADGSQTKVLEEPNKVVPGDRLVFFVRFKNIGASAASNFVVTNPMPAAVQFEATSDGQEIVSVDGGKSWGRLAQLRVPEASGGLRPAAAADVTHLQWNLDQRLIAGAEGKVIFRGVVR